MAVAGTDIDSHHHLWPLPDPRRYPWLARPSLAALNRPFGLADLAAAATGTGIGATVVVQAAEDAAETGELLRAADGGATVAGVVGWLDLADPAAPDQLGQLLAGPGGRRLVGIRANLRDSRGPGSGWLAGARAAALRRLAAEGLALDVLAGPTALATVDSVAAAHPGLRVILDHAGHPPLKAPAEFVAWAAAVRRFARHPNVAVKFSGLLTRGPGVRWDTGDLRPVADTLAVTFGDDRILFGSDWPVCLLAASYAEVAAAAREALSGMDASRIFGGNARSWYRLP